ncbi:MAG: hypothetical protein IJP45_07155, partial [Paludibacteraceae bacterium]|nr:hypothetical protein [Paludibacteraceae bacterium]
CFREPSSPVLLSRVVPRAFSSVAFSSPVLFSRLFQRALLSGPALAGSTASAFYPKFGTKVLFFFHSAIANELFFHFSPLNHAFL